MSSRAWARPWPRPSRRSRRWSAPSSSAAWRAPSSAGRCPTQPVLAEYGAGFPAFIAGHDAARDLPYLADVARLDWALNLAFHAPAGGRLAAADLAALPADRLPSLRLAAWRRGLPWSARPIRWTASGRPHNPRRAADPVDLAAGGVRLLVLRRPDDAAFVSLSAGEAAFVAGLGEGLTLEEAAGRAETDFDLSAGFARLLGLGVFAAPQHGLPCWHHNCAWFVRIGRVGLCCTARQVVVSNSEQCCGVIDHPYTPRASRAAFPRGGRCSRCEWSCRRCRSRCRRITDRLNAKAS